MNEFLDSTDTLHPRFSTYQQFIDHFIACGRRLVIGEATHIELPHTYVQLSFFPLTTDFPNSQPKTCILASHADQLSFLLPPKSCKEIVIGSTFEFFDHHKLLIELNRVAAPGASIRLECSCNGGLPQYSPFIKYQYTPAFFNKVLPHFFNIISLQVDSLSDWAPPKAEEQYKKLFKPSYFTFNLTTLEGASALSPLLEKIKGEIASCYPGYECPEIVAQFYQSNPWIKEIIPNLNSTAHNILATAFFSLNIHDNSKALINKSLHVLESLDRLSTTVEQDAELAITTHMLACYLLHKPLWSEFDLATVQGKNNFLYWYYSIGLKDFLPPTRKLSATALQTKEGFALPKYLLNFHTMNKVLKNRYDINTDDGLTDYIAYISLNSVQEMVFISADHIDMLMTIRVFGESHKDHFRAIEHLWMFLNRDFLPANTAEERIALKKQFQSAIDNLHIDPNVLAKWQSLQTNEATGQASEVKVIGFANTEFGIGEDCRTTTLALASADTDVSTYNISHKAGMPQQVDTLERFISNDSFGKINIFNLPAMEHFKFNMQVFDKLPKGAYRIGFWPWELDRMPSELEHCYGIVNEIWASTEYTKKALEKTSPVLVKLMPLGVSTQRSKRFPRKHFALPREKFIFLFIFDGFSYLHRKNPMAVLNAYMEAFESQEDTLLVIKAMNYDYQSPDTKDFHDRVKAATNVMFIDDVFSKNEMYSLIDEADAFVSLHRAEGFGRCIAESMMLCTPVITIGYSGNADFCNNETAFIVDHKLTECTDDMYPYGTGSKWADADHASAVEQMRAVYDNPEERIQKVKTAYDFISRNYNLIAVGRKYKERIDEILSWL